MGVENDYLYTMIEYSCMCVRFDYEAFLHWRCEDPMIFGAQCKEILRERVKVLRISRAQSTPAAYGPSNTYAAGSFSRTII